VQRVENEVACRIDDGVVPVGENHDRDPEARVDVEFGGEAQRPSPVPDGPRLARSRTRERSSITGRRRATSRTCAESRSGRKERSPFTITINLATGAEPWTVASGTRRYKGLRGRGTVTLDAWYTSPATFVMKGIVSESCAVAEASRRGRGRCVGIGAALLTHRASVASRRRAA
jgi:hypothetical protein